jgi:uncharacterized membrane protein
MLVDVLAVIIGLMFGLMFLCIPVVLVAAFVYGIVTKKTRPMAPKEIELEEEDRTTTIESDTIPDYFYVPSNVYHDVIGPGSGRERHQ